MQFDRSQIHSMIPRFRPLASAAPPLLATMLAGCAMTWGGAGSEADIAAPTAPITLSPIGARAPSAATPEPEDDAATMAERRASTQADAASPDEAAAQTEADRPEATALTHTIAAGDTLTRIAERYNLSISALLKANDLPNPDHLEVGQVIHLPAAPVDYTPSPALLPDSRLVRTAGAFRFDVERFLRSQPGPLHRMTLMTPTRLADGSQRSDQLTGSQIIERVSREYSVDARILLAFIEHYAGLVTEGGADEERQLYPLLPPDPSSGRLRAGLYSQLSWLADQLNKGYYDRKYRGATILETAEGERLFYHSELEAGSVALQFAVARLSGAGAWEADAGEDGVMATYRRLFGGPFEDARETAPADLKQPELTLPFPRGDPWRFTGGFHGGWGNGSAWSAIDFAPPDDAEASWCYTSNFPTTAVARGLVARLGDGVVVLDLDEDGDEGSGWTILYLHVSPHEALRQGQIVEAGNILGYVSCAGGFSTATHLHIARRYNGEWLPADCNRCPAGAGAPPFVMSGWKVVGLGSQLYQGFLVNIRDNRSVIAEQGRHTDVNTISW